MSKLPEKGSVLSTDDLEIWRYFSFLKRWESHSPNLKKHCIHHGMLQLFFFFLLVILIISSSNYLPSNTHQVKNAPVSHDTKLRMTWEERKTKRYSFKKFPTVGAGLRWNITIETDTIYWGLNMHKGHYMHYCLVNFSYYCMVNINLSILHIQ